jgi:cytochrome c-type biogenesis protein
MGIFLDIISSFVLGFLTPLTAVCVLPLYPAFLAFLSNRFSSSTESSETSKKTYALFGLIIVLGVLVFMIFLGLLFTTILQESLTNVIGIVSPIAFAILGIISLFLIFNFDFLRFLPKVNIKTSSGKPLRSAFVFGFFFGAIVIPCNPGFIAAFFARALLIDSFVSSMVSFLSFGIGLGAPLLIFSLASAQWSSNIIGFLIGHKRIINLLAGLMMLGIAIYYLVFVFKIFG